RRRHTRCLSDWSSDVCSSDLFLFTFTTFINQLLKFKGQLFYRATASIDHFLFELSHRRIISFLHRLMGLQKVKRPLIDDTQPAIFQPSIKFNPTFLWPFLLYDFRNEPTT